jgi:hypothetical protein
MVMRVDVVLPPVLPPVTPPVLPPPVFPPPVFGGGVLSTGGGGAALVAPQVTLTLLSGFTQVHVHGPVPVTALGSPTLHKSALGAAVKIVPFTLPHNGSQTGGITHRLAHAVDGRKPISAPSINTAMRRCMGWMARQRTALYILLILRDYTCSFVTLGLDLYKTPDNANP